MWLLDTCLTAEAVLQCFGLAANSDDSLKFFNCTTSHVACSTVNLKQIISVALSRIITCNFYDFQIQSNPLKWIAFGPD